MQWWMIRFRCHGIIWKLEFKRYTGPHTPIRSIYFSNRVKYGTGSINTFILWFLRLVLTSFMIYVTHSCYCRWYTLLVITSMHTYLYKYKLYTHVMYKSINVFYNVERIKKRHWTPSGLYRFDAKSDGTVGRYSHKTEAL